MVKIYEYETELGEKYSGENPKISEISFERIDMIGGFFHFLISSNAMTSSSYTVDFILSIGSIHRKRSLL